MSSLNILESFEINALYYLLLIKFYNHIPFNKLVMGHYLFRTFQDRDFLNFENKIIEEENISNSWSKITNNNLRKLVSKKIIIINNNLEIEKGVNFNKIMNQINNKQDFFIRELELSKRIVKKLKTMEKIKND